MRRAGAFISLDGVDGGGKSGAVRFLDEALRAAGHDVLVTREPGGTEEGLALRKLLLASGTYDWEPMAELLLMNASRIQHVTKVIHPALAAGKVVLCDRFVASTLAYQGAGRGIPEEKIKALHDLAIGGVWPDLTVVLDLDPRIGVARSRKRLESAEIKEDRFEALDLAFHERVRASFLAQAAQCPKTYVVVDANRPPEHVQRDVLRHIAGFLQSRNCAEQG